VVISIPAISVHQEFILTASIRDVEALIKHVTSTPRKGLVAISRGDLDAMDLYVYPDGRPSLKDQLVGMMPESSALILCGRGGLSGSAPLGGGLTADSFIKICR